MRWEEQAQVVGGAGSDEARASSDDGAGSMGGASSSDAERAW